MRRALTWSLALAGLLALALVLLLSTTTTGTSSSLSGDACRSLTMGGDPPVRAPDRETRVDVRAGEPFTVPQHAGTWRGRLDGDGARFAHTPELPPGMPASEVEWTSAYDLGWCRRLPVWATFTAESDGFVHYRAWTGDDTGLVTR